VIDGIPFERLYAMQRSLCSTKKVISLMRSIEEGKDIPLINVGYGEDRDLWWVGNGHHRATAFYLLGYEGLPWFSFDVKYYERTHSWIHLPFVEFVERLKKDKSNWLPIT
jgi:hypothetical protein